VIKVEKFSYSIRAEISPSTAKSGDIVTLKAYLNDVVGQVKNVYATVPQYGIWEVLNPTENNTYTINYPIPWMAPPGKYEVNVYAVSLDGQRGPSTTTTLVIE